MKQLFFMTMLFLTISYCSQKNSVIKAQRMEKASMKDFKMPKMKFEVEDKESSGSELYRKLVPDSEGLLTELTEEVIDAIYFKDSEVVPQPQEIKLVLYCQKDAVAATSSRNGRSLIRYSTDWIEKFYARANNDEAKVLNETKGVLLHELVHVFQLQPQGIGNYGGGGEYWLLIEGLADAVRVATGYFKPEDRPRGGEFKKGYRYSGFFLNWLREVKDKDFLRKLNLSTRTINPWSFDAAFKQILNDDNITLEALWDEYMTAIGDR
ncbi:MAG: basic secretory family protein [Tannerellaceae bacterium]|jgi:hypothetical protein|nr:basic secretory family protein [Tannerellaceae bacterium]